VDNPRPLELENGKSNPSPQLSEEQVALLREELLGEVDGDGVRVISGMPHVSTEESYSDPDLVTKFALLEKLQPDKENYEQEDAYKCCWDVVMSLYGEESVKLEQEGVETRSWVVRSGVVRLLLHYDFLYVGVGEINDDQSYMDGILDGYEEMSQQP